MLEALWQGLLSPFASVRELIEAGGPNLPWIVLACLVMWTVIVERYWYFNRVLPRDAEAMLSKWRARKDHTSWFARHIRAAMISRLNAAMSANLQILRVMVPLCPLLGLVATVAGMLEVFDSMALHGNADARTMAYGVSHAMIATMTGLAVSMTGLFPLFRFQARVRRETELLADKFAY